MMTCKLKDRVLVSPDGRKLIIPMEHLAMFPKDADGEPILEALEARVVKRRLRPDLQSVQEMYRAFIADGWILEPRC